MKTFLSGLLMSGMDDRTKRDSIVRVPDSQSDPSMIPVAKRSWRHRGHCRSSLALLGSTSFRMMKILVLYPETNIIGIVLAIGVP